MAAPRFLPRRFGVDDYVGLFALVALVIAFFGGLLS